MIFVSWHWHINNSDSSFIMDTFVRFIHLWIMPLFYVIAGVSAGYSLRKRQVDEYISERFKRLIIPIVGGVIFLIPPQIYLERLITTEFTGSYIRFFPHFFEGLYPNGNFTLNHLWFILYLFVISLISLPLLKKLKRVNDIEWMGGLKPWILLFPLIAIVIVEAALRYMWPKYLYPTDIMIFLVYFICGHYIVLDDNFSNSIKRYSNSAFLIGIVSFSVITSLYYRNIIPPPGHSWNYVAFQICWSMTGWCWVVAIMGVGLKRLNIQHAVLNHVNDAVLPFYVLHQTVILVIAYYIVQREMGLILKFIYILTSAFVITVSLCYAIKQFNVTRVMFGLKVKAGRTLEIKRVPGSAFWARIILWLSNEI